MHKCPHEFGDSLFHKLLEAELLGTDRYDVHLFNVSNS